MCGQADQDGKTYSEQVENPRAPKWATAPFDQFLTQTKRLSQILHLTMRGIAALRGMPKAIEVLAKIDGSGSHDRNIDRAKEEAELAEIEVLNGFPLLHAQAVVTLWSYMESLSRSFITGRLRNQPDALFLPVTSKLRVRLGEYEALSADEKISHIFDLLEQDLGTNLRSGVTRFEALLAPFELSGNVPDHVQRDIFELGQIRNALVHRGGVADKKLVENCPWLGLAVGSVIAIKHQQFERYMHAVHRYVTLLIVRIAERFGVDMTEFKQS